MIVHSLLTCASSVLAHIAAVVAGHPIILQCRRRTLEVVQLTEGVLLTPLVEVGVPLQAQDRGIIDCLAGFPLTAGARQGAKEKTSGSFTEEVYVCEGGSIY
jgi:hypothetical protein